MGAWEPLLSTEQDGKEQQLPRARGQTRTATASLVLMRQANVSKVSPSVVCFYLQVVFGPNWSHYEILFTSFFSGIVNNFLSFKTSEYPASSISSRKAGRLPPIYYASCCFLKNKIKCSMPWILLLLKLSCREFGVGAQHYFLLKWNAWVQKPLHHIKCSNLETFFSSSRRVYISIL